MAPKEEVGSGEEGRLAFPFPVNYKPNPKQSPWRDVKQQLQNIREWVFVHTQLHLPGCPYTTIKPKLNSYIGTGEWLSQLLSLFPEDSQCLQQAEISKREP